MSHPFPPMVRWIVAPGFLAVAGAAGGAATAGFSENMPFLPGSISGAALAAAAALTLSLSAAPRVTLILGPFVGVFVIVGFVVAAGGGPLDRILSSFSREPQVPLVIAAAIEGLLIPHLVCLQRPIREWGGPLAAYLGGGLVWPILFSMFQGPGREAGTLVLFGLLVAAFQLPALLAARTLAAHLTRPESGDLGR